MADEYISKEAVLALKQTPGAYGMDISSAEVKAIPAADVVPGRDFRDCRNELCLRCGEYKTRHLGSCDGCRWREE